MAPHPHLLFVFLDGVGLGPATADSPLDSDRWASLLRLAGGQRWTAALRPVRHPRHVVRPIDATLGVAGLPQSGTGQTALFTGVNAPQIAGRHYGPYPHSATRPHLAAANVFRQVLDLGRPFETPDGEPAAFLNAYPPRFFDYVRRTDRWTVTTRACLDAGLRIRTHADVVAGAALTAELTGAAWAERLGLEVPILTPEAAGRQALRLARRHAFTLFEYYLTDKAGHSRDPARAEAVLADVDAFFGGILADLDPSRDLLLIASDHGNLEDLSTKSHTRHPVPLIAYGAGAAAFADVDDLTGVVPAILQALSGF